jgi:hypothetical protein
MTDLQVIELTEGMRICSFGIEDMYTNVPKIYTLNIIDNILQNNQEYPKRNITNITNSDRTVFFYLTNSTTNKLMG